MPTPSSPLAALLPHPHRSHTAHQTHTPRRWLQRSVLSATLAVALTGCGVTSEDVEALRDAARTYLDDSTALAPPASLPTPEATRALLADLNVGERHDRALPAYERAAFGTAWRDVDNNGCNQRDDVLLRDAVAGSTRVGAQGRCNHDVLAGTWMDPYTGARLEFDDLKDRAQAQAIQIDHFVPLAEAWRSGAWTWTEKQRELFANDLDVLLAVDGPANASKSDGDPAAWRPRAAHQCTYAIRWITVKHIWQLDVDLSEHRALSDMLETCPAK